MIPKISGTRGLRPFGWGLGDIHGLPYGTTPTPFHALRNPRVGALQLKSVVGQSINQSDAASNRSHRARLSYRLVAEL